MVRKGPSAEISNYYQPKVDQGGIIGGMFDVLVGSDFGKVPLSAYANAGSQLRCFEFNITDSQKGRSIGVAKLSSLAKEAYLDSMQYGDIPLIKGLVSSKLNIVSAKVDSNGKTGLVVVQAPEVEIDNACLVAIKQNKVTRKDQLAIKEVTNSDSGFMVISISINQSVSSGAGTPSPSSTTGNGNDKPSAPPSATGTEESGKGTTKGAGGSDARAMYDGIVALFDDLLAQLMRMLPLLEIDDTEITSFKPNLNNPELSKVLEDFENLAKNKIEKATRNISGLALTGVENDLSAARNVQETIVNDNKKRLEPITKILAHLHTKHRLPGPLRTALIVGDVPAGFEADVGSLSSEILRIYSGQETEEDTDYVAGTDIPKNWMARVIDPIKDFIAENGWFLVTPPGNNRSLLNCQAASKESARGMMVGLISNIADACSVSIMAQFLGLPVTEFVVGTFVAKNTGYFSHRINIPGVSTVVGLASTGLLFINLVLNFFDISLSSGLESLAQKRLYDKMGFNSVITVMRDVGGKTQEIQVTAYEDHLYNIKILNAGKDSELFVEDSNARYQLHQAIWGVNYDELAVEKNRLSRQMMDKLGEKPTSESVNEAYQFIVESSNAPGMQMFLVDKLMAVVSPELAIEFTGLARDIRVNEDGSYGPKRLSFVLNEGARLMLDSIVQGRFPWFALVQILPALVTYLIDLKTEGEYSEIRDKTCVAVTHLDTELLDFLAPYCTQRTMFELRNCMEILRKGAIPRDLRTQMSEYVSGMIAYALVEAWELAQSSNAVPADAA